MYAFYNNSDLYNKPHEDNIRFFTKGLFCYLNVQGLEYNQGYKQLIWKEKAMNGKELEVGLRDLLTK